MLLQDRQQRALGDTFFSEAGEPVRSGTMEFPAGGAPDIARVTSIAQKCGTEMMPD